MQYQFDASQVDPAQGVEIWPDNTWVKVIATGHKAVPIRDKENQGRLVWTLKAVEGPLAGKTQFLGMNLWIDDTNGAAGIAKRELSALVWVTLGASQGRLNMADFSELENIPFYILSKHGYNNNTKSQSQDWGGYKDINGVDAGKQGPGGQQAAPQFGGAPGAPAAAPAGFGAVGGGAPAGSFPGQAPAAAPAPAFGQQPAFAGAPAPAGGFPGGPGAPAGAPGFAPQGAPAFGAPAGAPGGFGAPPATAPAPQFQQQQQPQQFQQPAQGPGGGFGGPAQGGFAPPAGQAPAGSPPWGQR